MHFISNIEIDNAILVDDLEKYTHPDQRSQWISIEAFDPPYSSKDQGLLVALESIKKRISASQNINMMTFLRYCFRAYQV